MDSVPASAVCNEAVKLAVKKNFGTLRGFVNGVLRNIARNIDNIEYPDKSTNTDKYLSVNIQCRRSLQDIFLKNSVIMKQKKCLKHLTKISQHI